MDCGAVSGPPARRAGTSLVVARAVLAGVFSPRRSSRRRRLSRWIWRDGLLRPGFLSPTTPGVSHSVWMVWLVSGAHDEFYADLRRPGRQDEDRALNSDQGLSTVPPL
ncbi:DUF2625 family protein [Streptomyces atratus]|uniref:DUF2625 family protein n=1 Tax=Streptomyces atratus TaxID=1893 RepID=UPI000D1AC471